MLLDVAEVKTMVRHARRLRLSGPGSITESSQHAAYRAMNKYPVSDEISQVIGGDVLTSTRTKPEARKSRWDIDGDGCGLALPYEGTSIG